MLKTQERQEEAIKKLEQKREEFALSDDDDQNEAMFKTGMQYAQGAKDDHFVAKLLSLLSLVDTDEKVFIEIFKQFFLILFSIIDKRTVIAE